jgi:predicted secreted protein
MGTRLRVLLLVAALTIPALAACDDNGDSGAAKSDSQVVTVKAGQSSATLRAGETLRIDFGKVNTSIGDNWSVAAKPDQSVLEGPKKNFRSDCQTPGEAMGCGGTLVWEFQARSAGRTDVRYQFCYQSDLPECTYEPGRGAPEGPQRLSVTVTA